MESVEISKQPSCADDSDPGIAERGPGQGRHRAALISITDQETVPIRSALGRVLAADCDFTDRCTESIPIRLWTGTRLPVSIFRPKVPRVPRGRDRAGRSDQ